jgi:transposase InsO family protein
MIMGFIDEMRSKGYAVGSVLAVLSDLGVKIAARTYRAGRHSGRPVADRTIRDALVTDTIRDLVWKPDRHGRARMQPEGLYGRRKMLAYVRRHHLPHASWGAVDRAMRFLGLSGARRDKTTRTTIPSKDGKRAGDLLNRDFAAPCPNHTWVTDFTYVRCWAGWVYVAFIVDCFAQRILAWHASTCKDAFRV